MATVALVPLLVLTLLQYNATQRLAEQLRSTSSAAVEYDLTRVLARTVEANAALLNQDAEVTRLALHVQALEVERGLIAGAGNRVARMAGVSRRLFADHPGIFLTAYTALNDGTRSSYPAPSGEAAGADLRAQPWYAAARTAGKMVWSRPTLSTGANRLVLVASMPIYGPDGEFAGVTAIELPIVNLLQRIDQRLAQEHSSTSGVSLVARMVGRVDSILVEVGTIAPGRGHGVRILARRAYQQQRGTRNVLALDWMEATEPSYRHLVDDVLARRSGVRRFGYQGHDSLWAYSPVSALGAAILLVLPFDRVKSAAQELDETLSAETVREVSTSLGLVIGVVAIATVLALVTAAFASRPIRRLAEATRRVGAGDLSARADVRGRDEIGQLASAFNAMVVRLEEGLRMRGSLELARAVQQNLLALPPPNIAGFDVAGLSRSCDETGGDYYDFLDLSSGTQRRLAVAVGDVTGHGIAAALLMANARALLRGILHENPNPAAAVDRTNELLCADINDGSFVTLALTVIDADRAEIRWVNAAHDPPIVFDRARNEFLTLAGGDIPLGINPEWHFAERHLALDDGELVVVLGTDGIWETENPAGEQFGRDRLRELIRLHADLPARTLCRRVVEKVDAFHGPAPQADDVTLVVVKVGIGVKRVERAGAAEGPLPHRTV